MTPSSLSQNVGASPPKAARADALLLQRWTEFRRCLGIAQSPCASDTERELPPHPPPYEELEAHYREMLVTTAAIRGIQPHNWAGYGGPWIENVFIAWAERANFSVFDTFYPLVPLFVQSVDACLLSCCNGMAGYPQADSAPAKALLNLLRTGLRRDVMYVMIVQSDNGFGLCPDFPPEEDCAARNVLVLGSGGWGNVPLPLIKGFVAAESDTPPSAGADYNRSSLLSFVGTDTHHARAVARDRLSAALPGEGQFLLYNGGDWKAVVRDSALSLCPRGFGRTAFRMSELVQLGVPQLYVYDDISWAPYWDPQQPEGRPGRTDVWGANGLGVMSSLDGLAAAADRLCGDMLAPGAAPCAEGARPAGPPFTVHANSRVARMAARAGELAASHFTYEGVMQRIFEYLETPWDADLVCVPRPQIRHR